MPTFPPQKPTMSDGYNNSDSALLNSDIAIPYIVRFWILLPFYIPALICSFFVLYHFICNQTLRQALHNHIITLLLIINLVVLLTAFPWSLIFYRLEYVSIQTPVFCVIWAFVDEALYITTTILLAWATIERHILIFHDRWMATKQRFILIHCLPVGIILAYCICYNSIVVLFPPCENTFDYSRPICDDPLCYYETHLVATWDVIVNDMIPTVIIIVCSVALLVRVICQKRRRGLQIRWRNYRKMTIQLVSISVLYLVLYIPEILVKFLHLCGVREEYGNDFALYADFFSAYGNLLLPFVCAGSIPELQTKLKNAFACWRRRMVGPQTVVPTQHVVVQHVIARVVS